MKVKIYQVNMERDTNRVAFVGYDSLPKFQGSSDIDSRIYDKVFEGEVNCFTLEKLYQIFNTEHPAGYKGRSMSVSDVVEIVDGNTGKSYFNYCDSFGFKMVSFEPDKTQISERFYDGDTANKISVLLVVPDKYPRMIEIEDSLEAMQRTVGGDIEEYMPFEDEVAVICNEEGKINGLPLNRAIYSEAPEVEMTYAQMAERFREVEKSREKSVIGYIVFTADSFDKPYSEEERTYVVSSNNKAFMPNMGGYSIYASSLDGSDKNVRIEQYMADVYGGKDGWKIERCYMKDDSKREMLDIIAGSFFVCYAPIESEKFQSLPKKMERKYAELFRYPEHFTRENGKLTAVPFKPKTKDLER